MYTSKQLYLDDTLPLQFVHKSTKFNDTTHWKTFWELKKWCSEQDPGEEESVKKGEIIVY